MPKSQLAGGSAAEVAADTTPSSDAELDPTSPATPEEPADDETPADASAASAVPDVTDDDLEDDVDEDLDDAPSADKPSESPANVSGAPAAEPAGEPFTFRADGKEFTIPGAQKFPEGVYIPTEAVGKLQEHLADRRGLNDRIRQLEQKLQNADPSRNEEVLRARALINQITALMDQGPEKMAEWLDNLEQNRPILEAKAQADALKRQLEQYQTRETSAQTEQQATELAGQMEAALGQHLDAVLKDPEIATLGLDSNRLKVRLYRMAEQLFGEADRDYPEYGIRKGDLTINLELLRAEVNDAAALARQYQGQAVAKQKAKAANAPAVNAGSPPPVVAGSKTAAPRTGGRPKPKNREEWLEQFRSGALDG